MYRYVVEVEPELQPAALGPIHQGSGIVVAHVALESLQKFSVRSGSGL